MPIRLVAALIIMASGVDCHAQAVELCIMDGDGPENAHQCSDAGFAWEASLRCEKLKAAFEPDEDLRSKKDFISGQKTFNTRVSLRGLDEACAFSERIFASTALGPVILLKRD